MGAPRGRIRPSCEAGIRGFGGQPEVSANWGKESVFQTAIAQRVAPARHRLEVFGQANARLLNAARATGHRQHIGFQHWVGLQECVFNHRCGQFDRFGEFAKYLWTVDAVICFARQGVIGGCGKTRATAVLFPLVPSQARGSHDIGHCLSHPARGWPLCCFAMRRPAAMVLRPKSVQDPSMILRCVALWRVAVIAFKRAPRRGPTESQKVVIKFPCTLAFGKGCDGTE